MKMFLSTLKFTNNCKVLKKNCIFVNQIPKKKKILRNWVKNFQNCLQGKKIQFYQSFPKDNKSLAIGNCKVQGGTSTVSTSMNSTSTNFSAIGIKFVVELPCSKIRTIQWKLAMQYQLVRISHSTIFSKSQNSY